MTDEERKAYNREKSRRYREKHANDLVLKEHVTKLRRQWCSANKEKLARQKRERYHSDPAAKAVALASGIRWREENPERWKAAQDVWRDAHREELKRYMRQYHKQRKLILETDDQREKRLEVKRDYYKRNASKVIEATKRYFATHPGYSAKVCATRRAMRNKAMPKWANKKAILAIYQAAKKKSAETGTPHHVDHIIPLKHKLVCGLHVPANLQILPGVENLKKSNRFSADHQASP